MRRILIVLLAVIVIFAAMHVTVLAQGTSPSINRIAIFDLPVASNANVLSTSLTPMATTTVYHFQIALIDTASVVNITISNGVYSRNLALERGTPLDANCWYEYTLAAVTTSTAGDPLTYNLQCETATTVILLVDETKVGNR